MGKCRTLKFNRLVGVDQDHRAPIERYIFIIVILAGTEQYIAQALIYNHTQQSNHTRFLLDPGLDRMH